MFWEGKPTGKHLHSTNGDPLAQLRLGLCSSSTEFWFGCQPASHPEPASLGIMMRLCARGEDSPTLVN